MDLGHAFGARKADFYATVLGYGSEAFFQEEAVASEGSSLGKGEPGFGDGGRDAPQQSVRVNLKAKVRKCL
jgi:hypothetical protein